MVNSGSFDSADGNRNGKIRSTQAGDAALGSQATNSIDAACKSDSSKSADEDLPSEEPAIEPTPSKTEINSVLPRKNAFPSNAGQDTTSEGFPSEKTENAENKCLADGSEIKTKNTRKLLCLYCDRTFVSANLRQKHVERVHSVKSARRVSARRQNALSTTPCDHCDKLNSAEHTLNDLFQHLVQEHATKYFGCLPCNERFLTSVHLADHYTSHHVVENNVLPAASPIVAAQPSEMPHKLTRSKLRSRKEEPVLAEKKPKLKNVRTKKVSLKSSKIALKRSKRIQQQAKEQELSKKKRRERRIPSASKVEAASNSKQSPDKPKSSSVNPYPEFDCFYRVKKITDHSIDNLKISSLTFDDVFDKAFFNRIKCNIEENLLHHIDGKLFKNEESESRISNFEKVTLVTQELPNPNADNFGCEISLNAITPAPSISLNPQFGEDFEAQIEYGSKPSKKKTQIKSDEVHYKYFTRRKYQASILQQKENRDLSKLDMWTQMVVKERQQGILDKKKSAKETQEYISGEEYKNKLKKQELNKILDRRGPFEDLKEEASKKAAFDKLTSTSGNYVSEEVFTDVREIINELLNKVFDVVKEVEDPVESSTKVIDQREIPAYLDLRRKTSSTHEEIDKSDKIALICSSQETENFELPTNSVRAKNEFVELTGEWARSRMYICAACGGKFSNMKYMLDHKSLFHPSVWVQHYEFVGNQGELYRHLSIPGLGKVGVVEETIPCKQWKRSDSRTCSKCGKNCNSLGELHRHVLECGGDWTWLLARKKYKYRPFGAKARRKRSGFEPKIQPKRKTEPTEKKISKKPVEGPRQRPSDADTIQRMLANLPAKRSRRCIVSLSDVLFKSRKKKKGNNKKPPTSVKCGKKIRNKPQLEPGKVNANQQRNCRSLRSFNKVLASRILDLNSSILVKRKMKHIVKTNVKSKINFTNNKEDSLEEDRKARRLPKKDLIAVEQSPDANKAKPKRMLTSHLNIKNFFPVKKKSVRSVKKSSEEVLTEKQNDINLHLGNLKNKKGGLKGFVRGLSLRKRSSRGEQIVTAVVESERSSRSKAKESPVLSEASEEVESKKRKLKRSFRNVFNKVKKLQQQKSSTKLLEGVNNSDLQPFLEEKEPVKVAVPAEVKEPPQGPGMSLVPIAGECTENPPIPETIFNLENNEEKSMQAKGNFDDDLMKPLSLEKLEGTTIDTSVKPKNIPAVSPNVKRKIRKPSRGLNDCIAMLTSKLQQKDDKKSSSLESLFSTSSTTSVELRPNENFTQRVPKEMASAGKPACEFSGVEEATNVTEEVPNVEETALDLSKKPVVTRAKNDALPPLLTSWTSVDSIIQQVVQNCDNSKSNVEQTIDSVVSSSLDWYESNSASAPVKLKQFRKSKRKRRSDDNLITNIIFGKDKLIIAPSKADFEDPLIAKIKQNEFKKSLSMIPSKAPSQEVDVLDKSIKIAKVKKPRSIAKKVIETDIDGCLNIQEIPDEDPGIRTLNLDVQISTHNEPIVMENKAIVKPISDSDDEVPLAVLVNTKEEENTNGSLKTLDINEGNLSGNVPYKDGKVDRNGETLETGNTDSLKENVQSKVKALKTVKKRKRKPLNGRKRLRDKNTTSSLSPEVAQAKNGIFALMEPGIAESAEAAKSCAMEETPMKLLNSQRTRRKSKSSKKIENIENDLFKNFALVINKKTKRIPPTSIVDDSVSDDILDSGALSKITKPDEVKSVEMLNDSVEEMDMEIEDIPMSTSIIERDNEQISALLDQPTPIEVKIEPLPLSLVIEVASPKEFEAPLKESTPKKPATDAHERVSEVIQESPEAKDVSSMDLAGEVPQDATDLETVQAQDNELFEKPLKSPSKRSTRKNKKATEPVEAVPPQDYLNGAMEDSGFVDKIQDYQESSGIVGCEESGPMAECLEEPAVKNVVENGSSGTNILLSPVNEAPSCDDNLVSENVDLAGPAKTSLESPLCEIVPLKQLELMAFKVGDFAEIPKLVVDIHHADQIDPKLEEYLVKHRSIESEIHPNDNRDTLDAPTVEINQSEAPKEETGVVMELSLEEEEAAVRYHGRIRKSVNYNEETLVNVSEIKEGAEDISPVECSIIKKDAEESVEDICEDIIGSSLVSSTNLNKALPEGEKSSLSEEEVNTFPLLDQAEVEVFQKINKRRRSQKAKNNMDLDIANIIDADDESAHRRSSRKRRFLRDKVEDVDSLTDKSIGEETVELVSESSNREQLVATKPEGDNPTDNGEEVALSESQERQVELAKLNIKDLLFSSFAPTYLDSKQEDLSQSKQDESSLSKLKEKDKPSNKKSVLSKKMSISNLENVLSTFTKNNTSEGLFQDIPPLTEIITNSEMDIAPVLDEIDKSLESEGIYDFYDDSAKSRLPEEDFKESKRKPRSAKLKARENIQEEVLSESETCSIKTKKIKRKFSEVEESPKEPVLSPAVDATDEPRRSRRGSRKVASYNENDLIDPIIDALENRRNRPRKENKAPKKPEALEAEPKPKLSSEELFDLLKKSSFENESVLTSKPISAFSEVLNEDSSNSASRGLTDGDFDVQESLSESGKTQYANKIYEFTEDSPENSTKDFFGINKKYHKLDNNDTSSLAEKKEEKNYCEICKKSFIRLENLVKHKTTLTHISKLSELEAKEAEEKARLEKENIAQAPEGENLRKFMSITDILQTSDRSEMKFPETSPALTNSNSLKLVDIISDVLNKPVTDDFKRIDKEGFNDRNESLDGSRRYKSLGERKSFESDQLSHSHYLPPTLTQTTILENQINLLENIIGTNLANTSFAVDETSNISNISDELSNHDDFVKPSQYEEISEDSKITEEQNKRKILNRDEELFLECCSLLKSGSEVSNSNYSKKPVDDVKGDESKLVQAAEDAHEYSDNSRTPTPLGDTFDDDASNSNTISSNWHLNSENQQNQSYSFEEVKSKEEAGITFSEVLTQGLRNQFQGLSKMCDSFEGSLNDLAQERKEDSDGSKVATKGARKVYEGLKVSIPTEDINLDVLNGSKKSLSAEEDIKTKTRKSKPVKKAQVGINLLFKINKKKLTPSEKQQDIYNFDESAIEHSDLFAQGNDEKNLSDNESLGYADSIGADAKSLSSASSISALSAKKPEPSPENITKKKYKIMGKIFKNAARSKIEDEVEAELRNIPEIPEMDNLELVENYVRSCQRVKSPFLPPPPPPPLEDLPKKPKMTEEEMNLLFDRLIGKDISEKPTDKGTVNKQPPVKANKSSEGKKRAIKGKARKRARANSESSGDEFNISKTTKKRSKKNNEEDSGINLELELKECIGVASRKSQRTCTSGKQNILVEYWSSDEEAFEAMLENNRIPSVKRAVELEPKPPPETAIVTTPVENLAKPKLTKKKPQHLRKKPKVSNNPEGNSSSNPASNRRKRTAANPLYHWSSSSEDESQSLIEIKPIREEDDYDEDRPVQHGWIVGDSPKKLVTMLALTKGKKSDVVSVKEQGKKRTSNAAS
ncbi:titin homolog [Euwallacea similis]|uniref:titin homolog n=1 Tax=Euwallacea similis TaxID=1736056 RepID=UPI00344CB26A